jgi:adenylate kinase|tara:strand:+ start:480 stop:1067 length:588 start_codon:yes stop_codon:yes gene_type:complete
VLGLAESKKVVVVGIPGVGKTTVVSKVVEKLNALNKSVSVHSFGTVMFEEAKKNGLKDRDDLRKLTVEEQKNLQKKAAEKIAEHQENIVIIDTHAFISTKEGYYPGLPHYVIQILKPTHFIAVSAKPDEIYNRRTNDDTRDRDIISIGSIKEELDVQDAMLSSCSVLSGSPMKVVLNTEGKVEVAADSIINAIGT